MGQYHIAVNLDKGEFIDPHTLGSGLKQWEILANEGVGRALCVLLFTPFNRGGGDLDIDENWHGPEREFPRDNMQSGPVNEDYRDVAKRTIGRWRGDRVTFIGDYAEKGDVPGCALDESTIYGLCVSDAPGGFKDVTDDVCRIIEHELNGKFVGDGWRRFVPNK